jgi:DUF1680 family protein
MSNRTCAAALAALTLVCATRAGETKYLTAVPFQEVKIHDAFWGPRLRTNRTTTVEANLRQCEQTGRIKNFAVAAGMESGKHKGLLFDDSDVYKMLEGIAYALAERRDPDLEKLADHVIDLIAAAQKPGGYLNTFYTLAEPQNRWQNIQYGHELYCAGHLIEAAVAYQQATGKRKLLDVARRLADHICATFGHGKRIDACGHEEVELALVKLYRATNDKRYLDQARFFLDVRGRSDQRRLFGEYAQDHKPVREQTEVTGHAVRAMYLYCAMADVAALTGDEGLLHAIEKIWHDVVERKMYVTGGIGPSAHNEGFTVPYDLPNDSAYAETCAAIGMALWNHRMFLMSGDGKYADVLEREVYNGLLSGVSLAGDRFFYVNPLGERRQAPPGAVVRLLVLSDQHRPLPAGHRRTRLRLARQRRLDRAVHGQHRDGPARGRQGAAAPGDEIPLGRRNKHHSRAREAVRLRFAPTPARLVQGPKDADGQRREGERCQIRERVCGVEPDVEGR